MARDRAAPPAGEMVAPEVALRREMARKLIHLGTLAAPLLVWLLPRATGVALLAVALGLAIGVEIARRRWRWFRFRFLRRFRPLLRGRERRGVAGATWLAAAYLLALVLFPKPVAVLAMLYGGAGDAVAALVGKRWGRTRTAWGKSWEGAGAGAVTNVVLGLAMPGISAGPAIAGGAVAALLEFLPVPVDDNIRVTLGGGAALWISVLVA